MSTVGDGADKVTITLGGVDERVAATKHLIARIDEAAKKTESPLNSDLQQALKTHVASVYTKK